MKKLSLFLLFSCLIAVSAEAQLKDALSKASGGGAPNPGSLLTQFAGALQPGSFLPSWGSGGKTNWLSAAGKVSNAVSMAKSVSSLSGFIKPTMFKQGFNAGSIASAASAVKTYSDASGVLKSLEGGLKPEAFVSSWAGKRSSWLSALSLLK
ncbi:MAG TPA: hypothetical protein VN824_14585 [Puia sp.]|nr:hypothetical protein [Puia sp.]